MVVIVPCPSGPFYPLDAESRQPVHFRVKRIMAVRYVTYHFTSLFASVTTRRHLNVIIAVAELLRATGGRMEQMEEQMGQMSGM